MNYTMKFHQYTITNKLGKDNLDIDFLIDFNHSRDFIVHFTKFIDHFLIRYCPLDFILICSNNFLNRHLIKETKIASKHIAPTLLSFSL